MVFLTAKVGGIVTNNTLRAECPGEWAIRSESDHPSIQPISFRNRFCCDRGGLRSTRLNTDPHDGHLYNTI